MVNINWLKYHIVQIFDEGNTSRCKILTGEILTNLMNFQQFINIFPIKIFHLVSYLPLMNCGDPAPLEIKLYQ